MVDEVHVFSPAHPFPSLLPSPMKPNGHWQMKLPSVFEQVASLTHLPGSDEHSSISGDFKSISTLVSTSCIPGIVQNLRG